MVPFLIAGHILLWESVASNLVIGANFWMIDQNTLRINIHISLISYACYGRLRARPAGSACTYVQYTVTLASLASLVLVLFCYYCYFAIESSKMYK